MPFCIRGCLFLPDGSPDHLDRWLKPHPPTDPRIALTGTETALLTYTSGTTGRPKGVQLSHDAFHYSFLCSALEPPLGLRDDDVVLMTMPNFHLTGSWVSLPALYQGGKVAILPFFEPAATLRAIQEQRATFICLVPAAIQAIMEHPDAAVTDFSALRRILYAGSPISAQTLRRAIGLFGCDFVQCYGATEMWMMTLLRPEQHDAARPESLTSCGTPVHFVEIRVADRAKDMIITGGENVYSVEVERALAAHPEIASVAVVGVPDAKWGEKVTAFVVLVPGSALGEDDLKSHCRSLIAGYKVPKSIHIERSLPQTASGKIQKAELRQRLSR